MNRRKFSKMLSVGIASLTVPILFGGCDKHESIPFYAKDNMTLKEAIDNYLVQADCTDYEQHKSIFRQNRCIIITDDYNITFDSLLLKKFKANAVVQVRAKGMVKCNFDIYKSYFQVVNKFHKRENLEIITTNIPGQVIKYFTWEDEKVINYPLKYNMDNNNEIEMLKDYSLPCILSSAKFYELMEGCYDY